MGFRLYNLYNHEKLACWLLNIWIEGFDQQKHTKQGRVIGTFSSALSTKYRILAGHSPSPVEDNCMVLTSNP